MPRGSGFTFTDTITGGVVPKQYIPAVETGVREYLVHGPLGFPVIDVHVNLSDGSYHTVDSSEMAFKTAARLAMTEGMPQCQPVLLEPIVAVDIHVPSDARCHELVPSSNAKSMSDDRLSACARDPSRTSTSMRRSRLRCMRSADPIQTSGSPPLANS